MKPQLRLVKVDGKEVEVGKTYLLMAVANRAELPPGQIPEVGKTPINMSMQPCRLQAYDDEAEEWVTVEIEKPIELAKP